MTQAMFCSRLGGFSGRKANPAFRRWLSSAGAKVPATVDVLVVGGGLVGASFAAAVAANPLSSTLSLAIVDPSPPPLMSAVSSAPPSLRTSTISPSSQAFLEAARVWQHVPASRVAPFTDMIVWDRPSVGDGDAKGGLGKIRFDVADLPGQNALGVVVDNDTLRAAAYRQLASLSEHADVHCLPTTVKSISYAVDDVGRHEGEPDGNIPWPKVTLGTGETVSARLIVAADGANSRIRTLAQFDWFKYRYGQSAVVANVALDRPITTAYQRFLSTGPIALLPVAGGGVDAPSTMGNVIWSTTPAEVEALMAVDDVVFVDELNAAFRDSDEGQVRYSAPASPRAVLDVDGGLATSESAGAGPQSAVRGITDFPNCEYVIGKRGSFPLSMGHAPQYVDASRRTVLLGDAAHNVHPLAGQGANLGFADASSLASAISSACATGRDIGGEDGAPLLRYERDRLASNTTMLLTLHTVRSLFGLTSFAAFNLARRLGVTALDSSSPLKRMILRIMS